MNDAVAVAPAQSRFQFSLADIFAALVLLAFPAALISTIDLEELDNPGRLPVAVLAGFFLGLFAAVQYRRAWNSRSIWFVPPFMLFAWSLFLLPYGPMRAIWPTLAMGLYVITFLSTALCLHHRKTGGQHTFVVLALSLLAGLVLSVIFSPGFPSRRRAMNEMAASSSLKALTEAQEIYNRTDYDKDGVREYSATIQGLFERTPGAADLLLIDPILAKADASLASPQPDRGYLFRILTAQGSNVFYSPNNAKSYLDGKGNLTGGYAFVAYPVQYKKSGFNTLLISSAGTILQRDLGPQTDAIIKVMTTYDPDVFWTPTE